MPAPQFTLYSHPKGPNPLKVAIVLEALGLTYKTVYVDLKGGEHKGSSYTTLNPNGRVPTLVDNETGFTLWESAAIVMYLVDKYDTKHAFSAADEKDKYIQLQWLAFQISGQGPYYGQNVWFKIYHPDNVPSAILRYENEALRVLSVLESVLSKQSWLVGDKLTVADLAFITWNNIAFALILADRMAEVKTANPHVWAWHEKMMDLPFVKEALAEKDLPVELSDSK